MAQHGKPRTATSNRRRDTSVGKSRRKRRSISPILLRFRKKFPSGTALELALHTGAAVRHCERCLAGHGDLGGGFLQALLRSDRSDFGRDALGVIMAGSRAVWWTQLKRQLDLAAAHRAHAAAGKLLAAITREVAEDGQ